MNRSGFSLQCNDFLPGKDESVFSSSSTSSSSDSEYEAESVASTFDSPSLVHMTANRPKPPARRPPSLKGKRKQAEAKDVCSDTGSVNNDAGKMNMAEEEASKMVLQAAIPKAMETSSEDEEEEESPFLGRDMLEGEEQRDHLSGEGVRQRFFRTRVIPSLDEEEEDIILGRSSTTSLLDSILSTIDMSSLSQPVSFPELGRDLIPSWQDAFDPVTNLK